MPPFVAAASAAAAFAQAAVAAEERSRGVTLVGPHRDDLAISIGDLPSRTHASQGEAWSLALALRLASYEVLADVGDRPVVLLDDVFSELDDRRRAQLAEACLTWEQVLVTAAVEADVPVVGQYVDVRMDDGRTELAPRPADPADGESNPPGDGTSAP